MADGETGGVAKFATSTPISGDRVTGWIDRERPQESRLVLWREGLWVDSVEVGAGPAEAWNLISESGPVRMDDLATRFGVSETTIRGTYLPKVRAGLRALGSTWFIDTMQYLDRTEFRAVGLNPFDEKGISGDPKSGIVRADASGKEIEASVRQFVIAAWWATAEGLVPNEVWNAEFGRELTPRQFEHLRRVGLDIFDELEVTAPRNPLSKRDLPHGAARQRRSLYPVLTTTTPSSGDHVSAHVYIFGPGTKGSLLLARQGQFVREEAVHGGAASLWNALMTTFRPQRKADLVIQLGVTTQSLESSLRELRRGLRELGSTWFVDTIKSGNDTLYRPIALNPFKKRGFVGDPVAGTVTNVNAGKSHKASVREYVIVGLWASCDRVPHATWERELAQPLTRHDRKTISTAGRRLFRSLDAQTGYSPLNHHAKSTRTPSLLPDTSSSPKVKATNSSVRNARPPLASCSVSTVMGNAQTRAIADLSRMTPIPVELSPAAFRALNAAVKTPHRITVDAAYLEITGRRPQRDPHAADVVAGAFDELNSAFITAGKPDYQVVPTPDGSAYNIFLPADRQLLADLDDLGDLPGALPAL